MVATGSRGSRGVASTVLQSRDGHPHECRSRRFWCGSHRFLVEGSRRWIRVQDQRRQTRRHRRWYPVEQGILVSARSARVGDRVSQGVTGQGGSGVFDPGSGVRRNVVGNRRVVPKVPTPWLPSSYLRYVAVVRMSVSRFAIQPCGRKEGRASPARNGSLRRIDQQRQRGD